jgi:hypothetical protein
MAPKTQLGWKRWLGGIWRFWEERKCICMEGSLCRRNRSEIWHLQVSPIEVGLLNIYYQFRLRTMSRVSPTVSEFTCQWSSPTWEDMDDAIPSMRESAQLHNLMPSTSQSSVPVKEMSKKVAKTHIRMSGAGISGANSGLLVVLPDSLA